MIFSGNSVAPTRIAIGLVQGIALSALYSAAEAHAWPATVPLLSVPALLVALFVPIIALAGWGNLRGMTLLVWAVVAAALLVGLGVHDVVRGSAGPSFFTPLPRAGAGTVPIGPSATLLGAVIGLLFIAHALVVAGDADRRVFARYPTYFDVAWKLELQLALSALFCGLFWLVVTLGAGLFKLIGIELLVRIIQHAWFAWPATTLALACAIHVTDVRVALVTGIRNLLHVLLSWLLPIATLLIAGFLLSLPFTGLALLWSTRFAANLLLAAAITLILLINATFGDGEKPPALALRIAGSAAALCLLPLIVIAGFALSLRVGQHGWTVSRIIDAAALAVAGCYGVGYGVAVFWRGAWLKGVERCNVVTSFVIVAVALALLTPLADPARLAVADQMARLADGRVAPNRFDYEYLRFAGRYGRDALERLRTTTAGPDAALIRERAERAIALQTPNQGTPPKAGDVVRNITVYPAGRALPEAFLRADWSAAPTRFAVPNCLTAAEQRCEAFLVDLDGDAADEIILAELAGQRRAVAFKADATGAWRVLGNVLGSVICESVRAKLRSGEFTLGTATLHNLEAAGRVLTILPNSTYTQSACP